MQNVEYETYIASDAWRERAALLIVARGERCERCGRADSLGVHHLTYERLGEERDDDLLVLCVRCHAGQHPRKLIKHGSVSSVFDAWVSPRDDEARKADERHSYFVYLVTAVFGSRHRRHVVQIDRDFVHEGGPSSLPHTIERLDLIDLFSEEARYQFMRGPGHEDTFNDPTFDDLLRRLAAFAPLSEPYHRPPAAAGDISASGPSES